MFLSVPQLRWCAWLKFWPHLAGEVVSVRDRKFWTTLHFGCRRQRTAEQWQLLNRHIGGTEGGCLTTDKVEGGGWEERGCWEIIVWRGKITKCSSKNKEWEVSVSEPARGSCLIRFLRCSPLSKKQTSYLCYPTDFLHCTSELILEGTIEDTLIPHFIMVWLQSKVFAFKQDLP